MHPLSCEDNRERRSAWCAYVFLKRDLDEDTEAASHKDFGD